MASIEEIKAALAASANEAATTFAQSRAAAASAERTLTQLQAIARGTNHPKVVEAVKTAEQCRQHLLEAGVFAQAAAHAAREYMGVLG